MEGTVVKALAKATYASILDAKMWWNCPKGVKKWGQGTPISPIRTCWSHWIWTILGSNLTEFSNTIRTFLVSEVLQQPHRLTVSVAKADAKHPTEPGPHFLFILFPETGMHLFLSPCTVSHSSHLVASFQLPPSKHSKSLWRMRLTCVPLKVFFFNLPKPQLKVNISLTDLKSSNWLMPSLSPSLNEKAPPIC